MSITHDRSVVTSGLVGYFDAANIKSYDSRENLVTYSSYNASTWSNIFPANATMTTGITAPDGTTTAVRFAANTSGGSLLRITFPNIAPNGTDTYTCSFYARLISGTTGPVNAGLADTAPATSNYLPLLVANEWVRIVISGIPVVGTRNFFDAIDSGTRDYVIDIWGIQVEKGPVATSYTPTSGSIVRRTTNMESLSATRRTNLVTNPSFEVDLRGWGSNAGATVARSTADAYSGTASALVTQAATSFSGIILTDKIPVVVGKSYVASVYVKGITASQNLTFNLHQLNSSDAIVRQDNTGTFIQSSADGWVRRTFNFTAAADVVTVRPMVVHPSTATAGHQFYVDAFLIEEASANALGTYFDGSTDAEAQWTGTAHYSTSRLRGPSAELRNTNKYSPSTKTRTNLCINPSLETNTTNWSVGTSGTIVQSTAASYVGSSSGLLTANGTRTLYGGVSIPTPVAGYPYTVSFYVRAVSTTANWRAAIDWNRASGFISTSNGTAESVISSGWTRVSVTGTAPAGTTSAFAYAITSTTPANGFQSYVDGALFEQSSTLDTYFDGDTSQSAQWTGTAHGSTSVLYQDTQGTFTFDGTNDFVTTNIVPSQTAGTFSIWFRMNALKDFNTLFDNGTSANDWECWVPVSGRPRFRTAGANTDIDLTAANVLTINQWHNLTITYTATGGIMYINGQSAAVDSTVATRPAPGVIHLGGANNTRLNGNISSFMYYNRALTAAEVLQNFNALRSRYGL